LGPLQFDRRERGEGNRKGGEDGSLARLGANYVHNNTERLAKNTKKFPYREENGGEAAWSMEPLIPDSENPQRKARKRPNQQ